MYIRKKLHYSLSKIKHGVKEDKEINTPSHAQGHNFLSKSDNRNQKQKLLSNLSKIIYNPY